MATRYAHAGPSRASTTAAPELGRAVSKKKRPGRGRTMLVKVFYSLASPRAAASTNSPHPPPHPTAAAPPSQPESHKYTCFARLNAPVWVQLLGPAPAAHLPATEYGRLTLKTCLSAICISRPELVDDPTKDYAVAAVDPYESFLLSNEPTTVGQGITEGKGMLSWNLAEKREGTTWVCGRVAPSEASNSKTHDDSDDDEIAFDTLEVWLQLVERPAFTQDQFLTSLRSFANPTQPPPPDTSERLSSPPVRQNTTAPSLGDPIKKKRPRETESLQRTFMIPKPPTAPAPTPSLPPRTVASTSALPTAKLAASLQLQSPDVLALLNQLVPSWPTLASELPPGSSPLPNFDVDSEEGRKLIPALAILARASGIDMGPRLASPYDLPPPLAAPESTGFTSLEKGKGREIAESNSAVDRYPNLTADTTPPLPSPRPPVIADIDVDELAETAPAQESLAAPSRRGKKGKLSVPGKRGYKKKAEVFTAIPGAKESIELDEAGNKVKPSTSHPTGCLNCGRKKSSIWRENAEGDIACNACGMHYNKKGLHRAMADRATSPPPAAVPTAPTLSRASSNRSLKGQLTLTCEADSMRALNSPKKRRIGGLIPPPSPSKRIGPNPRHSPGMDYSSIFRSNGATSRTASGHIMTSPGRSPRRLAKSLGLGSTMWAATSPVRGSAYTFGGGFGETAGAMSDPYDFSAIYAGNQSPSPERHARGNSDSIPTYLLTASPGTALRKVLSDTNIGIDMNGFNSTDYDIDMKDTDPFSGGSRGGSGMHGEGEDLSFFLRSSPEQRSEKENQPPTTGANDDGMHSTTAAASTDFDSLFRGDSTHLSSTAFTQPSSPGPSLPSSPCVQPRTSSATPGQKGKGAATSGRPAPSIHHSFMDHLIPGLALEEESDSWTPATAGDDLESMADGKNERYDISQLLLPSHSSRSITAPLLASRHHHRPTHPSENSDFDLPPSSPPILPSETFPTPSEFDSGITPEEEPYVDDDAMTTYRHPSELPAPRDEELKATQNRIAILLHSLDLPPIANDAWVGGQLDSETLAKLLQLIQVRSAEKAREDATWSIEGVASTGGAGGAGEKEERTTDRLYDNLFDSMET